MKNLLLRCYLLMCSAMVSLATLGQGFDDIELNDGGSSKARGDDFEAMDGMMDYQPIHFGLGDVFIVVLLLVACYVFGKIWRGCSYLILLIAAAYFYITRY